MNILEFENFFSKDNPESYIQILSYSGILNLDKFNKYIENYSKLVLKWQENISDQQVSEILATATDILVYTLILFKAHYNQRDIFQIKNLHELEDAITLRVGSNEYLEDGQAYVIDTIRTSIQHIFIKKD